MPTRSASKQSNSSSSSARRRSSRHASLTPTAASTSSSASTRPQRTQTTPPKSKEKEKTSEPDTNEYEVEAIYGVRNLGQSNVQFNVKWYTYGVETNTWEPLCNLENCLDLVLQFLLDNFAGPPIGAETPPPPSHNHDHDHLQTQSQSELHPDPHPQTKEERESSLLAILGIKPDQSSVTSAAAAVSTPHESLPKSPSPPPVPDLDLVMEEEQQQPQQVPEQEYDLLMECQEHLNRGGPLYPITIENTIDEETMPTDLITSTDRMYGRHVDPPNPEFFSSCDCKPGECNSPTKGPCECVKEGMLLNDAGQPCFDPDGKVSVYANKALWECGDLCGCGPSCFTKTSQRGRSVKLAIRRVLHKGWGVFLNQKEPIESRSFIARYLGEIITEEEAEERGRIHDQNGASYLFDLDLHDEGTYSVDAYKFGNESRFFNHSCDPNMAIYMLAGNDDGGHENQSTHSFWAIRKIYEGEELTFDYSGLFQPKWKKVADKEGRTRNESGAGPKQKCYCGAKNCRGWVL